MDKKSLRYGDMVEWKNPGFEHDKKRYAGFEPRNASLFLTKQPFFKIQLPPTPNSDPISAIMYRYVSKFSRRQYTLRHEVGDEMRAHVSILLYYFSSKKGQMGLLQTNALRPFTRRSPKFMIPSTLFYLDLVSTSLFLVVKKNNLALNFSKQGFVPKGTLSKVYKAWSHHFGGYCTYTAA